jgi:hypothetical protein
MAVRGDDPLKIKQRCGHTTFSTTELYIREAEAVQEGFGVPFPACQRPSSESPRIARGDWAALDRAKKRRSKRGGRDSNPRPPA